MITKLDHLYHLTQAQKRNIRAAYDFSMARGINAAQVNTMLVVFDFANGTGYFEYGKKQKCVWKEGETIYTGMRRQRTVFTYQSTPTPARTIQQKLSL